MTIGIEGDRAYILVMYLELSDENILDLFAEAYFKAAEVINAAIRM